MKKIIAIAMTITIILTLFGCTKESDNAPISTTVNQDETTTQTTTVQQVANWEWQHDSGENHSMDTSVFNSLHSQLDSTDVYACVVAKDGYIVDEYYKDGYDENSLFLIHSCSKSVTSALIGIAIDKGFIESVDVPISEYFPEILSFDNDYYRQITIRHILTHTSGISSSDDDVWNQWRASDNWIDYFFNRPITSAPGTEFSYTTGGSHVLAAIIQKATGKSAYEFGKEYLFDPMGMTSVICDTDPQGISDGGNGFHMTTYDMAKLGQLFLNKGQWQGEQLISSEWIDESTALQFDRSSGSADYGYQWWVRTFGDNNYPAYFAQGHGGQYIFVVPQLELVVVFTSNHTGGSSMYWQFENDIVNACQQ